MQLTNNFNLNEFTLSAGMFILPTEEQIFCIKTLCENLLQPIRDQFGQIKITSGLRNLQSYKNLKEQGYPVSATSDHFAWCSANPKGTGAADVYFTRTEPMPVFKWVISNLLSKVGQIILYPKEKFIHISNAHEVIFRSPSVRDINRQVMIHENGTFSPYKK